MAKYTYPAIFHKDKETGGYWVEFPDWIKANIGAYTDGNTLKQALFMAEDLLGLLCWDQELDGKVCPPSSEVIENHLSGNFIRMISTDTDLYNQVMKFINKRHLHYRYHQIHKAVERYKKWD